MVSQSKLTWLHCSGPGRRRRALARRRLLLEGSVNCREAESQLGTGEKFPKGSPCSLSKGEVQAVLSLCGGLRPTGAYSTPEQWGSGMSELDIGGSPDREAVVWVYPLKQTVQLVEKHQSGFHLEEARP